MDTCGFCQSVRSTRERTNPFAVAETAVSLIALGWYQPKPGITLVMAKSHTRTMLSNLFEQDLRLVKEAVQKAFPIEELQVVADEDTAHLNVTIYPVGDVARLPQAERENPAVVPDKKQLAAMRAKLQARLAELYHGSTREDFSLCLIQQTIYPPQLTT